ncbi:MAG: hypothetical protein IPM15_11400 [Betaproteobacteria bacterium]|jgi:hypothetical protein|nr:hypothetical protein [Betaproteobacteria bacterium]MCC6246810.1 hypothetical protein [Rubrivivax sp.]MCL4699778.1 hypothetical protein [Burkholderiaceae bacterium]
MEPITFLNHLANLFVPALALGALAAALAKLTWRAELAGRAWWQLAAAAAGVNAVVTLAGFALSGDGRMGTYVAMVLATTLVLWWFGFRPGRG